MTMNRRQAVHLMFDVAVGLKVLNGLVEIALGAGAHHGPTTMPGRHEAQDPWLRYDAEAAA